MVSRVLPWRAAAAVAAAAVVACVLGGVVGCERCGGAEPPHGLDRDARAPTEPAQPARTPRLALVEGWGWRELVGRARVALPAGCSYRERPLGAEVPEQSRWTTADNLLATLLVSLGQGRDPEHDGGMVDGAAHASMLDGGTLHAGDAGALHGGAIDGDVVWRPFGGGAVTWSAEPSAAMAPHVAEAPWLGCASCPAAFDAKHGRWLLAWSEATAAGTRQLLLWRGDPPERVAEGDGLEAIDLACDDGGRCALLTTEPAAVAHGGAQLWTGSSAEPLSQWRAHTLELDSSSGSAPLSVTMPNSAGEPVVALVDAGELRFVSRARDGETAQLGAVEARDGALDAAASPFAAAVTWLAPPELGCGAGRAGVGFQRVGGRRHELSTRLSPTRAALRPLADGYWLEVLAPQRCEHAGSVVYGALAARTGDEPPRLIALAEADDVAVATRGADVDLWLRRGRSATWIRARCTNSPAAADAVAP